MKRAEVHGPVLWSRRAWRFRSIAPKFFAGCTGFENPNNSVPPPESGGSRS